MRDHRTWTLIGVACAAIGAGPVAWAAGTDREPPDASKATRDARAVAAKVDHLLAREWAEAGVVPAEPAGDAEYLRRLSLDLVGKIPAASEARDFLDDPAADKRARLVERLLGGPAHAAWSIELWRQALRPEGRARPASPAFEAWLRAKVVEGAGYDEMAREVFASGLGVRPAAASLARKGTSEDIDAGSSRVFLGVRLECAQCHDRPFAGWRPEELRGLAAYFAGDRGPGPVEGIRAIPGVVGVVRSGPFPARKGTAEPLEAPADGVASPSDPRFAEAAVDRAWARFFGAGLAGETPTGRGLLGLLAGELVANDFEVEFLARVLSATRAYGLAGATDRPGSSPASPYSARPARALSAGQLRSSLEQATGSRVVADGVPVADATWIESSDTLAAVSEAPYLDDAGRVEELYLAALTRRPSAVESASALGAIEEAGTPEGRFRALADVFRSLLEGPEFQHYR